MRQPCWSSASTGLNQAAEHVVFSCSETRHSLDKWGILNPFLIDSNCERYTDSGAFTSLLRFSRFADLLGQVRTQSAYLLSVLLIYLWHYDVHFNKRAFKSDLFRVWRTYFNPLNAARCSGQAWHTPVNKISYTSANQKNNIQPHISQSENSTAVFG